MRKFMPIIKKLDTLYKNGDYFESHRPHINFPYDHDKLQYRFRRDGLLLGLYSDSISHN